MKPMFTIPSAGSIRQPRLQSAFSTRYIAGLAAGLAVGAPSAFAINNEWTGATSTAWNETTNWSEGRVPLQPNGQVENDDATINTTPANIATISPNILLYPRDFLVGRGGGINGRLDHVAGLAVGNGWSFFGHDTGTGVFDLETGCLLVGDRLAVNGNLDLTGGTLAITELAPGTASSYVVASYSGTLTGTFTSVVGLPAGWSIDYGTGSNSAITLTHPNADPCNTWIDTSFPGEVDPPIIGKGADPDSDGQSNLVDFLTTVNPTTTAVTTDLSGVPSGYEYRTFRLDGSNGLTEVGFLRAEPTETP